MRIDDFIKSIRTEEKPKWYRVLLLSGLLPSLLIWPILLFMSIFIFDNPDNMLQAWLLFFGINSIPAVFMAILFLSNKLFEKYKYISLILSAIPITVIGILLLLIFASGG